VTVVTGTLHGVPRRTTWVLAGVLLVTVMGCSGDDGDNEIAAAAPSTLAEVPPDAECEAIQVLLKLEITAEEQAAVAAKLDGLDGVQSHQLVDTEGDDEPSLFVVRTDSDEAAAAVGDELAGDPSVVSVVYPEQLC
jgi:hypothetical protein